MKINKQDKEKLAALGKDILDMSLPTRADELGSKYTQSKEAIAKEAEVLGALNEQIKELGKAKGKDNRKRKTVVGKDWEVGILRSTKHSFDETKLIAKLGVSLVGKMKKASTVYEYDRDKIRALIAAGKVKTSTLKSCLVSQTSERVFVRSTKTKEKAFNETEETGLF